MPKYWNGIGNQRAIALNRKANNGTLSVYAMALPISIPYRGFAPGGKLQGVRRKKCQPRKYVDGSPPWSQAMLRPLSTRPPVIAQNEQIPSRIGTKHSARLKRARSGSTMARE